MSKRLFLFPTFMAFLTNTGHEQTAHAEAAAACALRNSHTHHNKVLHSSPTSQDSPTEVCTDSPFEDPEVGGELGHKSK